MHTQSVKMDSTTLASFAYYNHIAVLLTQSVRLQSGQISLIRSEESVPAIFLFPQDKAQKKKKNYIYALLNVSNTAHTVKAAQAGELTSSQSSFYLLLSRDRGGSRGRRWAPTKQTGKRQLS